ncbi:HAD-IA family hydrolase [Fictibacillus iocasae]|uniref:HAD-IA family hydrolase n=1 Tax=Fictibacillus iocasae TaxID=2715437 RepID=A0ABW2NW83_9BACL
MREYIIFDFDGTLVDSKEAVIAAYNQIAGKHGFLPMEHDRLDELMKMSVLERCKALKFPIYKLPIYAPQLFKHYHQGIKDIIFFPRIKETLEELKNRGYKLAVISSNNEQNIREFLEMHEVDYIDEVFCSSSLFGKDKVINKFLKSFSLKPDEVLYVGDEVRDVVACKKTGVKVIWAGWGYESLEHVKKESPDYMASEPEDILSIV